MDANRKIKGIIRQEMARQGVTPVQLGKRAGMGQSTVYNILSGTRNMSIGSAE